MKSIFLQFLKDEDGQTTTEYVLIIVLVAMIVVKITKTMSTNLEGSLGKAFEEINNMITSIKTQ